MLQLEAMLAHSTVFLLYYYSSFAGAALSELRGPGRWAEGHAPRRHQQTGECVRMRVVNRNSR